MSLHNSLASAQRSQQFAHFADAGRVTYTPKGGASVALSAIVGEVRYEDRETSDGLVRMAMRDVEITSDPTGAFGGVSTPALNATVTVDGDAWSVAGIVSQAGQHLLALESPQAGQVLRPGYYGDR